MFDLSDIRMDCDMEPTQNTEMPVTPAKDFILKRESPIPTPHGDGRDIDFCENRCSGQTIPTNCLSENMEKISNNKRLRTFEEQQLREFDVLDEVGSEDEPVNDNESYGGNDFDSDSYPSDGEIDAMLEEGLSAKAHQKKRLKMSDDSTKNEADSDVNKKEFSEVTKILLDEKVKNPFEVLPDDWVTVTHESGMPLYLHKSTRVCTLAKPYFLGPGSARKHFIPISAIPCLQYLKAEEAEKMEKIMLINGTEVPSARVESVQENKVGQELTPLQFREYCQLRFKFKTLVVKRFKSWNARRRHEKHQREVLQRPTLPKNMKLITCPVMPSGERRGRHKDWVMNPVGKSFVCILHEYVQRVLKSQPVYDFKELEHTSMPYMAVVSVGNIQYGSGMGSSKKQAKHNAAKATLEIFIPDIKEKIGEEAWGRGGVSGDLTAKTDLSFFDGIKIDDPRVTELCTKTTEPLPHTILLNCLQRNFGLSESSIQYETKPIKNSKNEFTMSVRGHTATVVCQNKRDGKQKAAQALLKVLHPHVPSWGSLLRLYGNSSVKSVKEKKMEEQKITLLQNRGTTHGPNYAILEKLQEEMDIYLSAEKERRPIGKFVPPDDIDLPSCSNTDLDNVVL